jgi:RNA polymerase sigma-70 factor (ECF subfamily)
MSGDPQPRTPRTLPIEPLASELYAKSGAARYGLALAEFTAVLGRIACKYLPEGADGGDSTDRTALHALLNSLHVEDLALARACAAGNGEAWQEMLTRYEETLSRAALGITGEESKASELTGSVYADLYGTQIRDGVRVSKLSSYNGRGSLAGWLRTILAQQYVNQYRAGRLLVSLEEKTEDGRQFAAPEPEPVVVVDSRLDAATGAALDALPHEDRAMIASYFIDGLTLARVGKLLGVHESTISRRLEQVVRGLRRDILARLEKSGMSARQAEEALDVDVRDLTLDIRRHLTQDSASGPFYESEDGHAQRRRKPN